jgi:hypothetical protein
MTELLNMSPIERMKLRLHLLWAAARRRAQGTPGTPPGLRSGLFVRFFGWTYSKMSDKDEKFGLCCFYAILNIGSEK